MKPYVNIIDLRLLERSFYAAIFTIVKIARHYIIYWWKCGKSRSQFWYCVKTSACCFRGPLYYFSYLKKKSAVFTPFYLSIKSNSLHTYRKVASSRLSRLVAHFQTVYEEEFWCLCTVTFGRNGPKLNSRLVYCSRLDGFSYFWLGPYKQSNIGK